MGDLISRSALIGAMELNDAPFLAGRSSERVGGLR